MTAFKTHQKPVCLLKIETNVDEAYIKELELYFLAYINGGFDFKILYRMLI